MISEVQNLDSGLWTGPWTGLIRTIILIAMPCMPGVKGHVHVNQQQSFECIHLLAIEYATEVYSLSIY